MNANFSKEPEIAQQLKELTTLIEFLHKERDMLIASKNIRHEYSGKNGQNELKQLQEFLQNYACMAKQFHELRVNLSLTLPHELRTPLNAILGFTQYLMSQNPQDLHNSEAIFKIYSFIYESALRMHHLVENYLLYAKLQLMVAAPDKVKYEEWQRDEELPTGLYIQSVARTYAEKFGRHEDLRLDLNDTILHTSKECLQKIIQELLDNAFKFSQPGTPIAIITALKDQAWVFCITDQGRGMTAEQIAQIGAYVQFERTQYAQRGTGLGLAIVQLLVQLHGGNLRIESVPRQGTSVTITFPYSTDSSRTSLM
ncbi:sensor protein [Candidatus Vecturithrix granuli]|uniref:histidine kinase n=1 Tax=Vecturithrix granuli TaxID=1499967 RepID=A0A081BYA2_VECG1|nr:sensor protein [Candidatus Vecturithrix granuli]